MSQLWWPETVIRSLAALAQGDELPVGLLEINIFSLQTGISVWSEKILISSTGSSCSVVRIA